jgi:hypothetical protein
MLRSIALNVYAVMRSKTTTRLYATEYTFLDVRDSHVINSHPSCSYPLTDTQRQPVYFYSGQYISALNVHEVLT